MGHLSFILESLDLKRSLIIIHISINKIEIIDQNFIA